MANYISNVLKMQGIKSLPLFTGKNGNLEFDFNALIPMPESLDVTSGGEEEYSIVYFSTERCTISLDQLTPLQHEELNAMVKNCFSANWQQEIFDRVSAKYADATEEEKARLYELGRTYVENYRLYGSTSWYHWCIVNWGTKWNAWDTSTDGDDTIAFITAWSAPEKVIDRLAEMYPDKYIEHWWADESIGNNTGHTEYENGVPSRNYYEAGSAKADETYFRCWCHEEVKP